MSIYKKKPVSVDKLNRYSLADRPSKVHLESFAVRYKNGMSFADFADSLPGFLGAEQLREAASRIIDAKKNDKAVILGMGAHSIKVGLAPLIIQWMEEGILDGIALNGAGIIHDFEIAYQGSTSEEVGAVIDDGSFGMAQETGEHLNQFIIEGVEDGLGLGESVGRGINESGYKYKEMSLLANTYRLKVPVTVHVAMGTDIIHYHPEADGAAIGEGSLRDFRLLAEIAKDLDGGGVFINLGSAVIIPEVFLKVVTLVRNLGTPLDGIYTLNMDFQNQYRPRVNVTARPTQKGGGIGYTVIGHHEIMFPLLTGIVMEGIK
jgi:deoxyhypusine synthase